MTKIDREALELAKLAFEADRTKAEARKTEAEALDMEHAAALKALQLAKAQREEDLLAVSDDSNFTYTFDQGVDEESVGALLETVTRWDRQSPESDWHLIINSPGGYVNEGMHLFDTLASYSLRGGGEHHLTMTVRGMAASMGGILLQAADQRLMGPYSMMLIHQVSAGTYGPIEAMKDDIERLDIWSDMVVDLFVERSGRITRKKFERNWSRRDWWLNAKQAVKLGFADGIG